VHTYQCQFAIHADRILETVWWYKALNATRLSFLRWRRSTDMVEGRTATPAHDALNETYGHGVC